MNEKLEKTREYLEDLKVREKSIITERDSLNHDLKSTRVEINEVNKSINKLKKDC